jgi:electron transfer flavoprotein alpha subunit
MAAEGISVFVFAEHGPSGIEAVSLQLIGKARQLADILDTKLGAILLGHNLKDCSQKLIQTGIDLVFEGDDDVLVPYQAELYTEIIVKLMIKYHPDRKSVV